LKETPGQADRYKNVVEVASFHLRKLSILLTLPDSSYQRSYMQLIFLVTSFLVYQVGFNQAGEIDNTFLQGTGCLGSIYSCEIQPDGKTIIGGDFGDYNGITRFRLARINVDGTLDIAFDPPGGASYNVYSTCTQPDGKVIVAGHFTYISGTPANYICRLNPDGTYDPSFDTGTGANEYIRKVILQPDGKVLVLGGFSEFNGAPCNQLIRLNTDGSADIMFDPGTSADNTIRCISLLPDGKIIIAGDFSDFNGAPISHIARLNSNGTLDLTFDPEAGANNFIWCTRIQADGKILAGGMFSTFDWLPRNKIVRLHSDGSVDNTFNPGSGANSVVVYDIAIQSDGKILLVGDFTTFNGFAAKSIARINEDGSFDPTFDPGNSAETIFEIDTTGYEKAIVTGSFFTYDDNAASSIARIYLSGQLDLMSTGNNSMVVFPNPTDGTIYFNHQLSEECSIMITDMSGNMVLVPTKPVNNLTDIDLAGLESGTYFIVLTSASGKHAIKIVIY
jgi:uncharacterized delta-60 repeat protein